MSLVDEAEKAARSFLDAIGRLRAETVPEVKAAEDVVSVIDPSVGKVVGEVVTTAEADLTKVEGVVDSGQSTGTSPAPASVQAGAPSTQAQAEAEGVAQGSSADVVPEAVVAPQPASAADTMPAKSAPAPTRYQMAVAILTKLGGETYKPGLGPIQAFVTQMALEDTAAGFNPLATEEDWPGATDFNSAGVKNYPTEQDGIDAVCAAWQNGDYNDILKACKAQDPAFSILRCASYDTWGGSDSYGRELQDLLPQVQGKWLEYADAPVGTDGQPIPKPIDTVLVRLPVLGEGASGPAVVAVQVLLHSRGYDVGTTGSDGKFGPATRAALLKFQAAHGDPDPKGDTGSGTWRTLLTD